MHPFIVKIAFRVEFTATYPPMADRSLTTLPIEITEGFLEGLTSPYELYVADSTISGAGFGLFVREEIPAGKEIFRAAVPAVAAV